MNHFAHLLGRKVDRGGRVVRHQPPVAVALGLHGPDHETRQLFAQAVLAAAVQHDLAALHQLRKLSGRVGTRDGTERLGDLVEAQGPSGSPQALQNRGLGCWGTALALARPGGLLGRVAGTSSVLALHQDPGWWPRAAGIR